MPDISMCANSECPMKKDCYRNPASGTKPSLMQSWSAFAPDKDGNCENYVMRGK